MRFDVVSLFPGAFDSFFATGLMGKAVARGVVSVRFSNPREFTSDPHRTVDDAPYGGGGGMLLRPGPIVDAMEALDRTAPDEKKGRRVLLTPQGKPLTQEWAARLVNCRAVTLICGRYEGFDERVRHFVDEEISLGDFVLLGGEVAAMAVIEVVSRLVPGVLGNEASSADESHVHGLLEYPQYTRPEVFRGLRVPSILLSGDHAAVDRWRRAQALARTIERRPDLLAEISLDSADRQLLADLRDSDEEKQ